MAKRTATPLMNLAACSEESSFTRWVTWLLKGVFDPSDAETMRRNSQVQATAGSFRESRHLLNRKILISRHHTGNVGRTHVQGSC